MIRHHRRKRIGNLILTVDQNDFVQEVHREMETQTPKLSKCMGPWHRKSGSGTMLPISEFSIATRGPAKGTLAHTCNSCRDKHRLADNASYQRRKEDMALVESNINGVTAIDISGPETPSVVVSEFPRWRVTIIKRTVVYVTAKDYLDAGVAAGDGEVIAVERMS